MIVNVKLRPYWWFFCEVCRCGTYSWTLENLAYERHADCYVHPKADWLKLPQKAREAGCSDVYSYMTTLIRFDVKTTFDLNPWSRLW